MIGLGIDDGQPHMAGGDERVGGQSPHLGIVGSDGVAAHACRPSEHPDQGVGFEHAPKLRADGVGDVTLEGRLGKNPVEPHTPQRPRRLGGVGHVDERRMGTGLGEAFLGTMDRLGDGRKARQRAVDTEHHDRDALASERGAATTARAVAKWLIGQGLRRTPYPGDARFADLWMPAERPARRAWRHAGPRCNIPDSDLG